MLSRIVSKLNSKRGVSIMLALLLFLVCVLAGAAAITAAGANIGRYTYMREYQQQYLTAVSAARLIKAQLEEDNGKITAEFICSSGLTERYFYNNAESAPYEDTVYRLIWPEIKEMIYNGFYYGSFTSDEQELRPPESVWDTEHEYEITIEDDEVLADYPVDLKIAFRCDREDHGTVIFQLNCGDYYINFSVGYTVDYYRDADNDAVNAAYTIDMSKADIREGRIIS